MRNSKIKIVALVTLIVAVIGLTVAFAILSSNLNISGSAYVDPVKWGIYFDDLSDGEAYNKATIDENSKAEIMTDSNGAKTKIGNMKVTLNIPGDKVVYTVDLVNEGTIPVEIANIEKPSMKYDFITFKVTYTGTDNEVSVGDVIEAGKDSEPAVYNLTITINYDKELVSVLPTEMSEINFSYKLDFKQTDKAFNIPTTTPKGYFAFPEVSGKLGDNITFRYYKINRKNYGIAIEGTGAMYENNNDSSYKEKCVNWTGAGNYACSLSDEIMVRAVEKLNTGNEKIDKALNSWLISMKIGGLTIEDMGATRDGLVQELMNESGDFKLNSEELDYVMMVYDNIPNLKSVTMSEGITSLKGILFFLSNFDTLKVPNSVVKVNGAFDNAHINNFYPGTGITVFDNSDDTDLFTNASFKKIFLPEGITEIKRYGLQAAGDSIEYLVIPATVTAIEYNAIPYDSFSTTATIVNKTGNPFDWNGIIRNDPGEPFVVGTVTDGTKTIQIVDHE